MNYNALSQKGFLIGTLPIGFREYSHFVIITHRSNINKAVTEQVPTLLWIDGEQGGLRIIPPSYSNSMSEYSNIHIKATICYEVRN